MGDIKVFIKDRWPWILGGLVGLYLVFKYMGGSSAASSGDGGMAAYLAAQSQGASQAAIANAQIQASKDQQAAANALARDQLNAQIGANNNATQVNFLQAQGQVAGQVAGAASTIVGALNGPAIAAINSAAYENAAALAGAAGVAQSGYVAQASAIKSASGVVQSVAQAVGQSSQSTSQQVATGGQVAQTAYADYAKNTAANSSSNMNWANLGMAALALL